MLNMLQISPSTELSEWSEEWIQEILNNDEGEGLFFEFKNEINSKDPKSAYNLRKAFTSFANTLGGFIIFGIKDKSSASGWERLSGIQDVDNFAKELTNKLSAGKVVPHIFFEGPHIVEVKYSNKTYKVLIIKVNSSELKPHAIVSDSDGLLQFWMRGNSTAIAASYPYLTKLIEDSSGLRNMLAALFLDTEYVDSFADDMTVPLAARETTIPVVKINALINSEQSTSIIAKIPTDIELIKLIWELRKAIDMVNSYRDMLIQRRVLPLVNANQENKKDNDRIASITPRIKELDKKIRDHLIEKYAGIRDWVNVVQSKK